MKRFLVLSLVVLSMNSFAGLDEKKPEEMKFLGYLDGCSEFYREEGDFLKHAFLDAALQEELEENWNLYKNDMYLQTAATVYFDLSENGVDSATYQYCEKIYPVIKQAFKEKGEE